VAGLSFAPGVGALQDEDSEQPDGPQALQKLFSGIYGGGDDVRILFAPARFPNPSGALRRLTWRPCRTRSAP
jgi:hypothetical protein